MRINKSWKLEAVCAKTDPRLPRAALYQPFLDCSDPMHPMLVATDGFAAVAHPVPLGDGVNDPLDASPEGPIPLAALKAARALKGVNAGLITLSASHATVDGIAYPRPSIPQFPDWRQVAPKGAPASYTPALNCNLLTRAMDAAGFEKGCRILVGDPLGPVQLVREGRVNREGPGPTVIIMPVRDGCDGCETTESDKSERAERAAIVSTGVKMEMETEGAELLSLRQEVREVRERAVKAERELAQSHADRKAPAPAAVVVVAPAPAAVVVVAPAPAADPAEILALEKQISGLYDQLADERGKREDAERQLNDINMALPLDRRIANDKIAEAVGELVGQIDDAKEGSKLQIAAREHALRAIAQAAPQIDGRCTHCRAPMTSAEHAHIPRCRYSVERLADMVDGGFKAYA